MVRFAACCLLFTSAPAFVAKWRARQGFQDAYMLRITRAAMATMAMMVITVQRLSMVDALVQTRVKRLAP